MATTTETQVVGKVIQVAGPAIDIQFPEHQIPVINTAIHITSEGFNTSVPIDVMVEVAQHIGEGRVRTIALQPTDGMVRGMKAISLGHGSGSPGGTRDAGPRDERHWRAGGQHGSGEYRSTMAHPPPGARLR